MAAPTRPPRNGFNAFARRLYNPLGFSKAYNFILWFIFAGALLGFSLARFMYLNFDGQFCSTTPHGSNGALPGECYYYVTFNQYKIGIMLHLSTILPAGLLVVLQFTPFIRHKWILIHRLNGYLVLILYVLSTVGAMMILRHAFGGGLDTQSGLAAAAIMSIVSFALAIINIKRLQIEQHRAWMLRGWFYAGIIITSRIIMAIASGIVSSSNNYYSARPCAQLEFIHRTPNATLRFYPECASYFNGTNPGMQAVVHADTGGFVSQLGVAFSISFGMAIWVSLWLHAIGVEIYLHLTPAESERLRKVSYQRQLEAGMRHPGRAGLTADRLGDSEPWTFKEANDVTQVKSSGGATSDGIVGN